MSTGTANQSFSSSLAPISGPSKNQSAHNVGVTAGIIGVVSIIGIVLYLVFRLYLAKLYNQRQRHQASVPPPTKLPNLGLDPEAISMLPKFVYQPRTKSGRANEPNCSPLECAVCISELVEDDMVRVLPICKHFFHVECIDTWLSTHSSCPMCRAHPKPEMMKWDIVSASPPLPQLKLYGTSSEDGKPGLGPCIGSSFVKSPRKASMRFGLPFLKTPRGVSARFELPFMSTPRGASTRLGSPFMLTPRATDLHEIMIDATSDLHEIRVDA